MAAAEQTMVGTVTAVQGYQLTVSTYEGSQKPPREVRIYTGPEHLRHTSKRDEARAIAADAFVQNRFERGVLVGARLLFVVAVQGSEGAPLVLLDAEED